MPGCLKQKIHNYIGKTQDIVGVCEIDREYIIQQVIDAYGQFCKNLNEPTEECIDYISNDLVKFIGYRTLLVEKNDTEGLTLWDELNDGMLTNDEVDLDKIKLLLRDVPFYFLLSLLGYATFKEQIAHDCIDMLPN